MKPTISADTSALVSRLADGVYASEDLTAGLEQLCLLAVELIPGCDHASISQLITPARMTVVAASDDVARALDELQNEAGEGPCLDSMREERFQIDTDIATDSQWPRLRGLVLERTPVCGMIGYCLQPRPGSRAALNVFADRPHALSDDSAAAGAVLAAFAGMTLRAHQEHTSAANLRAGLESNREIGKAIGLLMATNGVDEAGAFDILRRASSRTNTRLATVAARVVDGHGKRR